MMPRRVFVDTSAWFAIVDRSEARHTLAASLYAQLLGSSIILVTTSLILAETYNLLSRRLGQVAAMNYLENINQSSRVLTIYPGVQHERPAKELLRKFHDQDFSLTDAVSFVIMRQESIEEAFTFDHHFAVAGFTLVNYNPD
jgi:hypothetical protein